MIALLISVPVAAEAHWHYGGGFILGLGAGLITGFALAPGPVYVAPPVYRAPPPPAVYPYYPSYVAPPVPPDPTAYSFTNPPSASSVTPPPAGGVGCREWKVVDRHRENRWDPYYGRWRTVVVERWGWVGVPCGN